MSPFWQRSNEGYLMLDHRASPGLTEAEARRLGYDPQSVREGRLLETATYTCPHFPCGTIVILNPNRQRERAFCRSCNAYICDNCARRALHPDYVHLTMDEAKEKIKSGRYAIVRDGDSHKLVKQETTDG